MDESLASYLDSVILTIYNVTLDILFYDLMFNFQVLKQIF